MLTLKVNLGKRSYPIFVGQNLLTNNSLLKSYIGGKQVLIVSNPTVANYYLAPLQASLETDYQTDVIIIPEGEQYKNFAILNTIFDKLIENKHYRTTTIIALGGGVIGDVAGFAAACYQRGVNYIQMPTSLLAQVDASIGGKTAINHRLGKNMIGAFYQPACVIIDLDVLATLPEREFKAGLAEIIKHSLIADSEFFIWLERNIDAVLAREPAALQYAIAQSCTIKIRIVCEDEKELNRRALLNLGHTFAHAIEVCLNYTHWLHGEAVAVGLLLAAQFSANLQWISHQDVSRLKKLLDNIGLPTQLPRQVAISALMEAMARDKKVLDHNQRLILLEAIGRAVIVDHIDTAQLQACLAQNLA